MKIGIGMGQLIDNERVKFVAAALDRASTGCFLIGVFAPISTLYQSQNLPGWTQLFGLLTWSGAGLVLHKLGYRLIGKLAE